MLDSLRGFSLFISLERGFMLLMITFGAVILIGRGLCMVHLLHLGLIVFLGWCGVDAINNIFDMELDRASNGFRAEFTERLGVLAPVLSLAFLSLSLGLGLVTRVPNVSLLISLGVLFGAVYSVPPLRLRQTILKPLVNMSVGSIPVLIVSAFYRAFSIESSLLSLLVGVTTGVNSLWEDLADYASDLGSRARTFIIVFGLRRGIYLTLLLGYLLLPLMILVGLMYRLPLLYYLILGGLTLYITLRILQRRKHLSEKELRTLLEIGRLFARDFVLVAVVHTTNLMMSSYLKYGLRPLTP
ncbi:hypothetical protein CW700_06020 [Candidatus Bathyarchaeota archaeon]|nr:MAG: hypothetical protein CW700_06020 [Candidatus Bathyarchaeota archaeon]